MVFTAQSDPPGVEWRWDFGDGDTAVVQNPVHRYTEDGVYDVTLTVVDENGCIATRTKPRYIALDRPEAEFSARYVPACPPVEATFTAAASSPYGITDHRWDFGDGTSATGNPATHVYLDTGRYVVSLTVVDGLGCEATVQRDTAVSIFGENKPVPLALHAASVVSDEAVRLSWEPSRASDFGAYLVYWQSPATGNWEKVYETAGRNDTSYQDQRPGVLACDERSYCYVVVQRNDCGTEGNIGEATPHCTVELEARALPDRILLTWNNYQGWEQVDRYEIYRVRDYQAANAQFLALVPGSDNSYVDSATSCFNDYTYRVRALGTRRLEVAWSDTAQAANQKTAPAVGTEILRVTVVDNRDIEVSWTPFPVADLVEVFMERSEDQGATWLTAATLIPGNDRKFRDTAVAVQEQSYWYRLKARDSCGYETPYSNLGQSIHLQASSENFANQLSWTPYAEWANGVDSYRIEVYHEASGSWVEVDVVAGDVLTYIDRSTFFEQGQYCYRIVAHERGGNQQVSFSNQACTGVNPKLYVPNIFTPNGDGVNETFRLQGVYLQQVEVRIYNRWGQALFVGQGLDQAWDGRFQGQPVPEGNYVYVVRATAQNGQTFEEKGMVTVVR